MSSRIRIIAIPPGEAPQWVREQWVGLELPLAQRSRRARSRRVFGVLTGPRGLLARWLAILSGPASRETGYAVPILDAVAMLERKSPEAARGGGRTFRRSRVRFDASFSPRASARSSTTLSLLTALNDESDRRADPKHGTICSLLRGAARIYKIATLTPIPPARINIFGLNRAACFQRRSRSCTRSSARRHAHEQKRCKGLLRWGANRS